MSTPHKATAEQWANVEQAKDPIEIHPGVFVGDKNTTIAICILELRARVEALEAGATCPHIITGDEGTSYCALAEKVAAMESAVSAPASSLVERVAGAMGPSSQAAMDAGELPYGSARAAIREVAAWLRDRGGYPWAWVAQSLEQEADR